MAFSLFRKKRRKKPRVRIYGAPPNHASGRVSPRRAAPARKTTPAKRGRKKARRTWNKRYLLGVALRAGITLFIIGGLVLMVWLARKNGLKGCLFGGLVAGAVMLAVVLLVMRWFCMRPVS